MRHRVPFVLSPAHKRNRLLEKRELKGTLPLSVRPQKRAEPNDPEPDLFALAVNPQ